MALFKKERSFYFIPDNLSEATGTVLETHCYQQRPCRCRSASCCIFFLLAFRARGDLSRNPLNASVYPMLVNGHGIVTFAFNPNAELPDQPWKMCFSHGFAQLNEPGIAVLHGIVFAYEKVCSPQSKIAVTR